MRDSPTTTQDLLKENALLKKRIRELEQSQADVKQTEKSLKESENRYRSIFENTGAATVILEEDKTISLANTEFERLTGYTRDEIEGRKKWTEFVTTEDLERMAAQHRLRRIDAAAALKNYEFHLVDKDGHIKDIHICIDIIHGTTNSVASLLDITDRKQAVEDLRESQRQLADIIDFLPDATFVIDKQGTVIAWNRAMEEMTGIKAADILGRGNYEYALPFYGERRPILIDLVLKPQDDVEVKYTYTERKDTFLEAETYIASLVGREVYLYGKASILRDSRGDIVGAIESIRDITSRKQAEEALKYSEERFSKAFHISPAPTIISTIEDGKYVDANDSFLRMLGYTRDEVIGHTAIELAVWADINDRNLVAEKYGSQGFVRDLLLHLRTKKGEIRDVLASAEIIALNGSQFVLSIFYDITDQEKLESRLRQAQKMEAIGTLAGGIAHDFNNILSAIMGYTEIALLEAHKDEHLRQYLEQIFKASERARDLVKQILAFSRKTDEKLLPVRVTPVIGEVLKLLKASLPSTIKISKAFRSDSDMILADPTQIHQILMNLCTNAAHALRDSKGSITIGLDSEEIKAGTPYGLPPGTYVKIVVSDTGVGMDPSMIGRIFEPFFSTRAPGEGTGLGLSVVYGIVKNYDGTITVQSEPGQGTEFCIYLPLLGETGARQDDKSDESIPGGKECILLVDDEEVLVELGKRMLASLGYDVIGKTNSLEALDFFRECPERFDLVITDMTMPNMTGIELARELMKIRPDMPIILCTGFSEDITAEKVNAIGLRALVFKPITQRTIAKSIRLALVHTE